VFGTTLLAAAAAIVLFVVSAGAIVAGSPSNFEASDGNMFVNTAGHTDWNCFANGNSTGFASNITVGATCFSPLNFKEASAKAADPSGEVELKNGSKFDDQCPELNVGHNPPKDEFQATAEYTDVNTSTLDTFFYGASIRPTTNGNSSGNLELDQIAGNGTTQHGCRSSGDRLIAYDFVNGGTTLEFHVLTYITSLSDKSGGNNENGATGCFVKSNSPPCWGAHEIIPPPNGTEFEGGVNTTKAIPASENGINGTALPTNAFNEMGVNLSKVLGLKGCFSFPQQVWESRSSASSFSSNPQDLEFQALNIENCGKIKIIKQTDPRGQNKGFGFTSNIPSPEGTSKTPECTQSASNPSSFTLNDSGNAGKMLGSTEKSQNSSENTQDCVNVIQGPYTVSENAEPPGFTFESLNCTADAASGSSVTTSSETASITLKPRGEVTCLYINQLNKATLATEVSNPGPVFPSEAVHDTATVTGNQAADTPSGTVTFFLCGPIPSTDTSQACDGTTNVGAQIGTGMLSGSGASAKASSPDVNTTASSLTPGRYCFRAEWPGDTNYPGTFSEFGGSSGTNECFTIEKIKTTTKTTPSVGSKGTTTFGSSVTDHAVVTAERTGGGTPTGTVTFFVCDPTQTTAGACPTGGTEVGSPVATTAVANSNPPGSSADSSAITANKTGTWCFRAVYAPGGANGSNYFGSEDASSEECFTVTDTTGSSSEQTWKPNDTATVQSAHGAPLNGTLSVQLFTGNNCGETSGSAVSGQLYQKTLTNATSTADRTLTTTNTSFTVETTAAVSWSVVFTSSDPNVTKSAHCENTSLTVTN
jgi:hypothetical protein